MMSVEMVAVSIPKEVSLAIALMDMKSQKMGKTARTLMSALIQEHVPIQDNAG